MYMQQMQVALQPRCRPMIQASVYVDTIAADASNGGTTAPTQDFTISGPGALQGSNAAEALIQAINSPNVDDTYTKLQFLVETPVITINPIGDHAVGDKFTVTGTTNLAVGDNVLFTIYSSSFQPTDKSASGEFSGASGTVQVTQGTNGLNAVSFDVDASTFKPDEYLVTAQSVGLPRSRRNWYCTVQRSVGRTHNGSPDNCCNNCNPSPDHGRNPATNSSPNSNTHQDPRVWCTCCSNWPRCSCVHYRAQELN